MSFSLGMEVLNTKFKIVLFFRTINSNLIFILKPFLKSISLLLLSRCFPFTEYLKNFKWRSHNFFRQGFHFSIALLVGKFFHEIWYQLPCHSLNPLLYALSSVERENNVSLPSAWQLFRYLKIAILSLKSPFVQTK